MRPPAADERAVWVAETFLSVQGEGPSTGRRAAFIRLSGCHLSCSWCDTAYTWDASRYELATERRAVAVADLAGWVRRERPPLVVLTGGEPLLQQPALTGLAQQLAADDPQRPVEVETSGTIRPRPELVRAVSAFNVSPKLSNSGLPVLRRLRLPALQALHATGKAVWKFVVTEAGDLDEVGALIAVIDPDQGRLDGQVWIMPEGASRDVVLARMRQLAGPVIARGWNLTPRLQVLLWEADRGH